VGGPVYEGGAMTYRRVKAWAVLDAYHNLMAAFYNPEDNVMATFYTPEKAESWVKGMPGRRVVRVTILIPIKGKGKRRGKKGPLDTSWLPKCCL